MATSAQVLEMLIPQGGWAIQGDSYDSIHFLECEPITQEAFEAGFAQYDAWKLQQETEKETKRKSLLDKLGITEDEARLLLG